MAETPAPIAAEMKFVGGVVAAVLGLKMVVLLLDPTVRLFMGDSASYLWSAVQGTTPPDRSFTYPMLIAATAGATDSIAALLLVQTVFGVATASLVCMILRSAFGVRRWLAAAVAIAIALEPAQLFYERMVMTEAAGTLALVASVAAAFAYLRNGRLPWLVVCVALGVALSSLRVGLVPLALSIGTVAVLLSMRIHAGYRRWILHLAVALVATWGSHDAYKNWYAARAGGEPAYLRDAGIFRLGLVAPLVKAAHFDGLGLRADILSSVTIPLANPRLREHQIWLAGGLIDVLRQASGDRARVLAGIIATRAILADPLGVLRLGIQTDLEYFEADWRRERLWSDLGAGQLPDPGTIDLLRTHFAYDASGVARTPSLAWSWFGYGATWLIACLFALLPMSMAVAYACWPSHRRQAVLLLLLGAGLAIGQTLCAHIISFRYLHAFPVFVLLCIAILVDVAIDRYRGRDAEVPAAAVCPA